MAKRKSIRTAGRLVTGVVYTASKRRIFDTEQERAAKRNISSAARETMNLRHSWQKLEQVFAANFSYRDIHVTLTYDDDHLPEFRDEAKKTLKKFIRQMREYRRDTTGEAFLYIYVTEGRHGRKRLHHHIVMNATGDDIATIKKFWTYGNVRFTRIGVVGYTKLAMYLTKEPRDGERVHVGERTWTPCMGLSHPKPDKGWVPDNFTITVPPGANVLLRDSKQNEYGEFTYLKYLLPEKPEDWPAEYHRAQQ